ncbi:MAG: molybdopterin cofactor-binding domain-containing protein, partial [Rhodospirillaceae bacterium]
AAATDAAFAGAARIVRLSALNQRVSATPMETRSALGTFDPATGGHTLYAPSQGVHRHKMALTAVFGVDDDRVRVVTPDVGGGFGQRTPCYPEYALVVWAARRCGRPVKWSATRSDSFLSDFQARDVFSEGELALDADGRFLAVRATHLANLGAYAITFSVIANVLRMAGGPYVIPAMHVVAKAAFSNTIPISVYRGAGRPEVTHLLERMIDIAAQETGLDRAEIRRRNLIPDAALPYRTPLGHVYDSGAFAENMDIALRRIDWAGFPGRRDAARRRGLCAGIGVVTYLESPSGAPMERADIAVLPDGGVVASIGTQASGQGHETSFAQVVATALELPLDRVSVVFGDSDRERAGGGTHSDRSMRLGGTVLLRASETILAQARMRAADLLEAAPADLGYADGRFAIVGTDRSVGLAEIASAAPLTATDIFAGRLHANPNGVVACEVELDPETGALRILRYVTVDDVGTVVNPMIVEGQVHGGIAQGAGQALGEHCVYDGDGQYLAASFLDYGLPRADDLPSFDVTVNSRTAPSNPLGVKGAGECGTTPATAAIAAALVDALAPFGVRHVEMPFTPERLWRAARVAPD